MPDYINLKDDSANTGKKLHALAMGTGTNTLYNYCFVNQDPTDATSRARVLLVAPGADEAGLVVRNIPSGTQSVSLFGGITLGAGTNAIGGVSVSNWPATQAVTGTFWPATQPVSGPLTDTQLRASAVPVSGTFYQATQPVSGTVTANVAAASGTNALNIQDGGNSITVDGPLTDAQLRAAAVPVSGTFYLATQPVSGTITANAGSGTFAVSAASLPLPSGAATETTLAALNNKVTAVNTGAVVLAAGTNAIGSVTVSNFPASQAVTGTFFQATQPVSAAALPLPSGAATESTLSTLNGKVTAVNTGAVTIAAVPTLTKGTQGATGLSTQDLKDAGRTPWSTFAEAVAGGTSEALVTLTIATVPGTAGTNATSYTVPAAKTLRLTHIAAVFIATTTTANTSKLRIRALSSSPPVLVNSAVLVSLPRMGFETATFIANESSPPVLLPLPDGLEFPAGSAIGVTHQEAAANGTIDVQLFGFLY